MVGANIGACSLESERDEGGLSISFSALWGRGERGWGAVGGIKGEVGKGMGRYRQARLANRRV